MRIVLAASLAVAAGLIAAGALGVAGAAETSTTTTPATTTTTTTTVTSTAALSTVPPRSVSVQGVAMQPIEANASASTATGVYRQAMAAAIVDGQAKAQFLATKAGATLGAVQSISEGGGSIDCPGELEYQGEQPDFGSGGVAYGNVFAGASVPAVRRPASKPAKPAKPGKKHRRHPAKKAALSACTLSTQVTLVYALS
jgi:hypothetical protein